ncbi:MAG: metallophosphoesterase [Pirellula sp.]
MKIWFISDTHNKHRLLQIPGGLDAVIHCGDESEAGNAEFNEPEARRFFEWFSQLEIPTKIFVPGNHSTAIEKGLVRASEYPAIQFLIHDQLEWNGLKIFGSPYTPKFFEWAYMKPRPDLDAVWQSIPSDIDILITHGPPKGVCDMTCDMDSGEPIHVGSQSLMRHVEQRIRPRIHAFGHIHDESKFKNFGSIKLGETMFINCSCCDVANRLKHHGIVIELPTTDPSRGE